MNQTSSGLRPPPFESALLLADQESNAAVDKVTLRSAGIPRLRFASSGLSIAAYLAERVSKILLEETEIIVCLPNFKDITAIQFGELIRSHPLLSHVPMLAIASDPAHVAQLKQCGYNGVLLRPFNTTTLNNTLFEIAADAEKKHLQLLDYLRINPGIPSSEYFQQLLHKLAPISHENLTPVEAYKYGIQLMRDFQWDEAFPFMEKACGDRRTRGNAYMALSAYWTIHQENFRVEDCLHEALRAFMDTQQWDKAGEAAIRLLSRFPYSPNPFLPELEKRARQNQHETVLTLVKQAKRIDTDDEDLAEAIYAGAKNSMTPSNTVPTMASALEEHGFVTIAGIIVDKAGLTTQESKRWAWFQSNPKKKSPASGAPADIPDVPPEVSSSISLVDPIPEPLLSEKKVGIELREETGPPENILNMPLSDNLLEGMAAKKDTPKASSEPKQKYSGSVIRPLGGESDLEPSALGDIWTVMRGTLRMARKKR